MTKLIMLELNEINFDYIEKYTAKGLLPNFAKLIQKHGFIETISEKEYCNLEPWVQWVTAHTGLSFDEHKVFRLGDIVNKPQYQIWEKLEKEKDITVGAVSPMNATNELEKPAFFIPDPWTVSKVSGTWLDKKFYNAVAQVVNDNAQEKVSFSSLIYLMAGALIYSKVKNWPLYCRLALSGKKRPWRKALFLDLILVDLYSSKMRSNPDYSSLFLNAGAHIQHHYLYNSSVYDGVFKNPDWYILSEDDPVLEVYTLYDNILGTLLSKFENHRFMIATGLHQDPYFEVTFYYRLKNHAYFLNKIDAKFLTIEPRMSRDFLVSCNNAVEALETEEKLLKCMDRNGIKLFETDNRGEDIFVTLEYPHEIVNDFVIQVGDREFSNFDKDVALVAIKNGHHNGIGYFLDTHQQKENSPSSIQLSSLFDIVFGAFREKLNDD